MSGPQEYCFGGNPGGRLEVLQIIEGEIGTRQLRVQPLATDLEHSQNFAFARKHRGRDELLYRCALVGIGVFHLGKLYRFKNTGMLDLGEGVEELHFFGNRGMRGNRSGAGNRDGARGLQLVWEKKPEQPLLQTQQGNFGAANPKQL